MRQQSTCTCGHAYYPRDFLAAETATCPKCGDNLCLATCPCGARLTDLQRELESQLVWSGAVTFKCVECGKSLNVTLESRKNRGVIALISAIVFGVLLSGSAAWQGASAELVVLAGLVGAALGAGVFYFRFL